MKPSDSPEFQRLLAVCVAMEDADYELTLEEFAAFYVLFRRAVAAGAPFHEGFVARVEEMNRDARGGMEDGDDDTSVDDGRENADPDEDVCVDDGHEDDDPDRDTEDADEVGGNLGGDDDEVGGDLGVEDSEPRERIKARTRVRARSMREVTTKGT